MTTGRNAWSEAEGSATNLHNERNKCMRIGVEYARLRAPWSVTTAHACFDIPKKYTFLDKSWKR